MMVAQGHDDSDDDLEVDSDDRYRVDSNDEGEAQLPFATGAHDNDLKQLENVKYPPLEELGRKPGQLSIWRFRDEQRAY